MKAKRTVEIEDKTAEEAIKRALQELGLTHEQVKIEILCEEEKGLFGMAGAKLARVRVSAK